jgi:uncharacterized protein (TIGR03437 family)
MNLRNHLPELALTLLGLAFFAEGTRNDGCDLLKYAAPAIRWLEQGGNPKIDPSFGKLPLSFELNAGQAGERYQLLAHGAGHDLYLSSAGVSLALYDGLGLGAGVIEMSLADANTGARWEPIDSLPGRMNYFIGPDSSRWLTNIPTYSRVRYRSVYPGIDVDYYGNQERLEHDFIVAPGADPSLIRMRFSGVESRLITPDGSLDITTEKGRVMRWQKPVIYQEGAGGVRREVAGGYRMVDDAVGFSVAGFDRRLPLVIDPVVSYTTFAGRNSNEAIYGVAADAAGGTYVVGVTASADFSATPGAPTTPTATGATGDVFVTKLNATGTAIVYTARVGGIGLDGALGMAVDAAGNVYVTGGAENGDFPTTAGAFQTRHGGRGQGTYAAGDCFLFKLNSSGSALLYSTFLGGSGSELCRGVAVDGGGNAYVAGYTDSNNFPVTENARQRTFRGGGEQEYLQKSDAFVAKINPTGAGLVYSTLVGGSLDDAAMGIAVDSNGSAYVTGFTTSSDFPVTATAAQRTYRGTGGQQYLAFGDAFVLKMNADGSALTYSTYLGGRADEIAYGLALDAQGNAYITGASLSPDFPVTDNAYQKVYRGSAGTPIGAAGDAFVAKLNPQGSAFVYATYLGGTKDESGIGIAVDASGAAYIAGFTLSPNFPVSTDAKQAAYRGENPVNTVLTGDAFLARLDPSGSALTYSTYLGGVNDDAALTVAVDSSSNVYVGGTTASADFPSTPGTPQSAFGGGISGPRFPVGDGFITKFTDFGGPAASGVSISAIVSAASYAGGGVAPGEIVTLTGVSIGPSNLTTLALTPANTVSTTLAETRVLFDDLASPLIYASAGQTSVIVPYEMAGRQSARVIVEYRGSRSGPVTVPILAAKPALFSANASGRGPGAIQNEDFSLNTPGNASAKGRVVILYGTGEGQTTPPGVTGSLSITQVPRPVQTVSVTIGGRQADVLYAGAAPSQVAGLFQVNVKVPEDVPSGNQEVIVTVGSARSQTGLTVAVR